MTTDTNTDKTIEVTTKLCGGISTLESGFTYDTAHSEELGTVYFLCNKPGDCFAKFWEKSKTFKAAKNITRAENEAIIGFKILILNWK